MKKIGIINAPISTVISHLGHSDTIAVVDAGFPIPKATQRIDLALKRGTPGFIETLEVILEEMYVEKAYIANEIMTYSPNVYEQITKLLPGIPFEMIPHVDIKKYSEFSHAVIRTGEFTPYSNIILVSGAWGFKL